LFTWAALDISQSYRTAGPCVLERDRQAEQADYTGDAPANSRQNAKTVPISSVIPSAAIAEVHGQKYATSSAKLYKYEAEPAV
jgi:hypothetical protein